MNPLPALALTGALFVLPQAAASAEHPDIDKLVAVHAKANGVPESLVHRVIRRESGYRPEVVHRGNIGLMQIKLNTARGLGYTGTADGLRDADTNLAWATKYLAGAYRVANGNHDRAVHYYAAGYYYAAKAQGVKLEVAPLPPTLVLVPLPRSRPSVFAETFSYFDKR